ncbi:MAG: C4-dicarboxylate ABC transporter permease [Desulfatitalea sp. BRH_c12]|nr:MAG: C4-dicarboxylate ABC transporter permease [Desulfatitalea sp. BRH_c12]
MDPLFIGLAGICALFVLLLIGMPITYTLALVGFAGISLVTYPEVAMATLVKSFYSTFTQYSFTVIPLFILMGELATMCGLSQGIYNVADKWMRQFPGGLCIATIGACSGFAAICGSSVATAATLGRVALPEMERYGYDRNLATGSVAAGGTLGFLIPPSIGFVVFGILTEQSIGKLLISGFLPGSLLAIAFILIIVVWVKVKPEAAPVSPGKVSFKDKLISLKQIWELMVGFILVMGGLYAGFFTPTEAAGVGAFFLFCVTLLKKSLTWTRLKTALQETTKISTMIFMILAGAYVFTYFMTLTMIPMRLADWLTSVALSRYIILAIILIGYLVMGCFLDATSMMVLTLPVIFPTILKLGFDPIWFGVISVLMMEAGLITPPLGLNVFVISGVANVPLGVVFRGASFFIIAIFIVVALITIYPQIATFLPSMMH